MKLFLFFIIVFSSISCINESNQMTIYKYEEGNKIKLSAASENLERINMLLNSIIKNADEFLRLFMDEERFESLKNDETVYEFIFQEEINIETKNLGQLIFKKIMIPITGDFASSEGNSNVKFFIGDEKYFPEPISNKNGYEDLSELKMELEKIIH